MRTGGVDATTRPGAFPIKANDYTDKWIVAHWKSVNASPITDPDFLKDETGPEATIGMR